MAAGLAGAVFEAFMDVEDSAEWLRNPGYTTRNSSGHFLENYGYVEPVGPGRMFECPGFRVGFLALGPRVTYPDHAHPAEEVYHVLAGGADWRRDDGPWEWRRPGAAIHHPPMVPHATRTEAAPVVALYCWTGEIGPNARLEGDTGPPPSPAQRKPRLRRTPFIL